MARLFLVEYDPTWPERFERLQAVLRSVIGDDALRIDHIGSTSVPGLASKDVIDIQVTVASLDVADGWPDPIGPFQRRPTTCEDHAPPGEVAGPLWQKRYWSAREPPAHLHVRQDGRPNQRYALLFRDYLRSDARAARSYEHAKRALAVLCEDTAEYSEAKDPICDLVMLGAEPWAARTGWT